MPAMGWQRWHTFSKKGLGIAKNKVGQKTFALRLRFA